MHPDPTDWPVEFQIRLLKDQQIRTEQRCDKIEEMVKKLTAVWTSLLIACVTVSLTLLVTRLAGA
jgi:muramidase (phage lysozyme)